MKNKTKGGVVRACATAVSVGAPLAATLSQFPVWIYRGDSSTISGCFVVLAFICALPFFRQIKAYMKNPSAPVIWAIILAAFILVRNIVDQMLMVSVVGLIANLIGTGLYKLGDHIKEKPDKEEKEEKEAEKDGENIVRQNGEH